LLDSYLQLSHRQRRRMPGRDVSAATAVPTSDWKRFQYEDCAAGSLDRQV